MKNKEKKQLIWIAGIIIVAIIILLPNLNLQKFAISDSDWILEGTFTYPPTVDNITVNANGTMTINFKGTIFTFNSGEGVYYTSNASTCDINPIRIYSTFPYLEGTNKICNMEYILVENDTLVNATAYYTIYTREVETIQLNVTSKQLCEALGGNYGNISCRCPDNSTWLDSDTKENKVCGPIKEKIEPTIFEKYGIAVIIFVIMGSIIIYLIWKSAR